MIVTLVGVRNIEDVQTKDGHKIDGIRIFIAYTDEYVEGHITDTKYIDRKVFSEFSVNLNHLIEHIGCEIDVEFSPTRKVVGIRTL